MRLDELAIRHGTDKGTQSARGLTPKRYTTVYERYLAPLREEPITLLEIGVQTGASLRMWEDYFPRARIFGIDIKEECLKHASDRSTVLIGDQTDREFLRSVVDQTGPLDVVVDDGGHHMDQHRVSLEELFPHVRPGGLYCVEDLHTAYRDDYGGGLDRPDSTIELFKRLIDSVNNRGLEEPIISGLAEIGFSRGLAILTKAAD
jgi:SAM-dependent methyltransferase